MTALYEPTDAAGQPLNTIYAEDIRQLVRALAGTNDPGPLTLSGPIASPGAAPSIALQAGGVTGTGYEWAAYWITGTLDGAGAHYINGRTLSGPSTAAQNLSSQEAVATAPGSPPAQAIGWGLARTKSGGGSLFVVSEAFLTSYGGAWPQILDNTPDASLTTAAPTANTTGTALAGILSLLNGSAIPAGATLTNNGTIEGGVVNPASGTVTGALAVAGPLTPNGGIVGALGTAGQGGYGRAIGRNLIWNSSARYGMAGWSDGSSSGWSGHFSARSATTYAYYGAGSGWDIGSSAGPIPSGNWTNINSSVIPIGQYVNLVLSANASTTGLSGNVLEVYVDCFSTPDASGSPIGTFTLNFAAGSAYGRDWVGFATPQNTQSCRVFIQLNEGSHWTSDGVYVSEIQLEIGTVATPYDPSGDLNFASYPYILIPGLNAEQVNGITPSTQRTTAVAGTTTSTSPVTVVSLSLNLAAEAAVTIAGGFEMIGAGETSGNYGQAYAAIVVDGATYATIEVSGSTGAPASLCDAVTLAAGTHTVSLAVWSSSTQLNMGYGASTLAVAIA